MTMSSTAFYDRLAETASNFVLSTSPKTPGTNEPDRERFHAFVAPSFTHSWGHKHFVSTNPGVQGDVDANEFFNRMTKVCGGMQTWEILVREVTVDERRRTAVVRADFMITIGENKPVVNDIVWYVTTDESGEKVVGSREFIDAIAANELAQLMRSRKV
jgi:ketosteroid isomerase-like protein